jgi:hypothetical protein
VVIDWAGYTIGYYGRPFEARNKVTHCLAPCDASVCMGTGACLLLTLLPPMALSTSLTDLCCSPQPKGSSFVDDNKEYFRFKLGAGSVVPAIEEAVAGMKPGAIRRLIVPVELGYADNDWHKQGPPPTTFAVRPQTQQLGLGNAACPTVVCHDDGLRVSAPLRHAAHCTTPLATPLPFCVTLKANQLSPSRQPCTTAAPTYVSILAKVDLIVRVTYPIEMRSPDYSSTWHPPLSVTGHMWHVV